MKSQRLAFELTEVALQALSEGASDEDREFAARVALELVPMLLDSERHRMSPDLVRLVQRIAPLRRPVDALCRALAAELETDAQLRAVVDELATEKGSALAALRANA